MGIVSALTNKLMDYFGRNKEPTKVEESREEKKPISSYSESPSTYLFDQFKVSLDRIATIREVRELVKSDLRFKMTNLRLAADATRGGFKVVVHGSETHRQRMKRLGKAIPKRLVPGANIAQQIIDDFLKRTKLVTKSEEYLRCLLRDGDLFLNPVVDLQAGLILDVRRAPALTIKRNSDEYGEFPDPERAFSQIDPISQINSLMEIGPPGASRTDFALYQMNHIRWLAEETEHYGTSHYASARATFKILQRMERAAAIRREFRSVQKNAHKLPEGTQEKDALEYARMNRLIDENGNPTKNSHLLSDFFGTAEIKAIQADANLSEMGDIEYFDDLLWLNLGVPKAILTSGQNINRDILKVQYPQYLKSLDTMTQVLEYGDTGAFSGIRALIDLQLLLAGINPESITYDVVWSDKSDETPSDRLERSLRAYQGGAITRVKLIQEISDDFDIEDPVEMAQMVEEERARNATMITPPTGKNEEGSKIDNETVPVADVALEDRGDFEKLEQKAKDEVLRFFRAVSKRMTAYGTDDALTDAVLMDYTDDEILSVFDDSWEAEQGKYQTGIVKWMTLSGVMGAEKAAELVAAKQAAGSSSENGVTIKPRITRSDIRDDLLQASGERITGLQDTTRKWIREKLSEGYAQNLGWREIMKLIEPVIVDEARAEMIARSELSWAYNRSALRVYGDAGIEKVEWNAVMDLRTCGTCRERHGKVYPIDQWPGLAHPRCRCTPIPVRE